jgi:protein-S-isoprenylcysteine O-methyltransferase Ste14
MPYVRIGASVSLKGNIFFKERQTLKRRIQLNGIVIFLAILIAIFFFRSIFRHESYVFDGLWEILGIGCILAGQVLRVSARGYKAEESRNGNSLVTGGPYAMVRNPMYLGIILIGCGVVLAILNAWVMLLFLGGFLLRYWYLFNKEEKILMDAFGRGYKDYMSRVPRIIPKLSFLYRNDISSYVPIRLSWFRREMPSIIIILAIVFSIESWEEVKARNFWSAASGILPQMAVIIVSVFFILYLSKRYETIADKDKHKK